MSKTLANPVLVLNKGWSPVGTVNLQRAIIMLFTTYKDGTPKAKIIDPESYQTLTWSDWSKLKPSLTDEVIQTANIAFKVPEIILLTRYDKLPQPRTHFSRRTLYKRDNHTCQYCGSKPGAEELSVDHIKPKSKGGDTSWTNCVIACTDCNRKKADRTPEQAGMKLLSKPKKPTTTLYRCDLNKPIKSWNAFISEAFWTVELENDMGKNE